ncbi:alpha/beta fold hydrolase [Pseudonocardia sp. GCM10023141]|uniref:alpha/beta fold hydrolase n=1 Tax=Pseudonocardia sp. GCM10023141 TaxID=3252653 RepID=UPI0036D3693B
MAVLVRDGVALDYEETGHGGPPIVLVHGAFCDRSDVGALVEHYRSSHRVVAVDLRGHGRSDAPVQNYPVDVFAGDVAWLCAQLGVHRPVVIGHSLGGQVALQLAADHPDLPAAVVALDSTIVPPPGAADVLAPVTAAIAGPNHVGALQQFMAMTMLPTDERTRAAGVLDRLAAVPRHVVMSTWADGLLGWDSAAAAAACRTPLLYLDHGSPNCDLVRLAQLCPQLAVGRTVGAGHWALLEVPDQVTAMIDRFMVTSLGAPVGGREGGV